MTSKEIRQRFLNFFKKRGHVVVPSARLVPENDPTTLFTGSGMQPMIPYLLGEDHPLGVRIADSQKSFRAEDIEEVGDNRHTTFFEMLGNWSFGDYFRQEQLTWMSEFLFDEIGIDPQKLYVTVFIGDEKNGLPKDTESSKLWQEIFSSRGIKAKIVDIDSEANGSTMGMQGGRIFYYNSKKNWWSRWGAPEKMPVGDPGGPDTEMFYDFGTPHDQAFGKECHPNCDCGRFMEIGNNVFMMYKKVALAKFEFLPRKNVDFGGGLERITAAANGDPDVFKIDTLGAIIAELERKSGKLYNNMEFQKSFRIVADHCRAAVFLIRDAVEPSNNEQGYFTRRLLRRAVRHADKLGIGENALDFIASTIMQEYSSAYPIKDGEVEYVKKVIVDEENKFRETLEKGLKEFDKVFLQDKTIQANEAFILFTTFGFPVELTTELAKERGGGVDLIGFEEKMKQHQDLSRVGSEKKFKGGLADHSRETVRLHTAHHLLLAALQTTLGDKVKQRGSNITAERLRIDFSFERKMTDEEKKKVEELVNSWISEKVPVVRRDMPKAEAEALGALHEFGATYGDIVSVYFVERPDGTRVSKEFCGGPHVTNTSELSHFKILKEEAVAAGIRRIKAILE